jgi:ATP phosphoribosyltransferase
MALEDSNWCAIRAMVRRGEAHAVIERLEAIGASAIIETRIANCRL